MKRRIVALIVASAALAVGGCSNEVETTRAAAPPTAAAWDQPPRIEAVMRQGSVIVVQGVAGAGSRVVLRGMDGSATAAAADARGRFEVRMATPSTDVMLAPEIQSGEAASPSPDRLVILAAGPIALVSPGEPARRLDPAGPLGAIDADGSVMVLGGRAVRAPEVEIDGVAAAPIQGRNGRWRVTADLGGATRISVDGRSYLLPGAGASPASDQPFVVQRAGEGWWIGWAIPPSGRQTTWLPDPQP